MAYKILLRRNGKHAGELGPYSSKSDADADARFIRIKLSEPADVVVQRVEIGGVKYAPKGSGGFSPPPMKPPPPKGSGSKPSPFGGGAGPFDLFGGKDEPPFFKGPPKPPPPPRRAAGGFVVDADGLILLREPKNHFDGYVWTFPKGGIDPGETDAQGALREVNEEAGVEVQIVAPIPGEWKGGTSINRYFLMDYLGDLPEGHDDETEQIAFVTYDEAKNLLSQTTNKRGRERDLEVLDAGYTLWLQLNKAK